MKLNETYLHGIVMSSINKLIKEDISEMQNNYFDDIKNGVIDYMDCRGGDVTIEVIGASDKSYIIKCHARRDETYAGSRGDYYNPLESPEYNDYLEINSVLFIDEYMPEKDIINEINIEELESWIMGVIDWDSVENIYTLEDRYWDSFDDDRYDD